MAAPAFNIALISMHSNPFAEPGQGDVGGMNVVVKHGAHALREQGHEVNVYTRRESTAPPEVETHGGVRLHRLPAGPARPATKAEQEAYVAPFGAALRAASTDAARRGRAWHVVHSHHWFSGAAAIDLAKREGLPHIQSFHSIAARGAGGWSLGEQPEGPGRVPAESRLAKESDVLIAVSRAEAQTIMDLGAAPERVRVVPPGVDHDVFHPEKESGARRSSSDRPIVLVAARLEPLKGIDLALTMLSQIPRSGRPRLVISGAPTGGFEGYDHHLHQLVENLDLTGDVSFAGPMSRTELAATMRGATVVVIPSHSETYGLVALEAAACGTPVLAAKVGGLTDAVDDGATGFLVEGRDPKSWAKVLTRMLREARLHRQLSEAAISFARDYTWERMATDWVSAYTDLRPDTPLLR